jgi:glycosyltransferase involved in cell wall biosynthesis
MKLFIQIPCFNEEKALPITLRALPKSIKGVDDIEILVINDGSSDKTVEVAKCYGVNHILCFNHNRGLAEAFSTGLEYCLAQGADIIVNTDADNQYYGPDIIKLVRMVIDEEYDLVIGDRQTDSVEHFSYLKKKLQKFGSYIVRRFSGTSIPDTTSGFRAYSRRGAMELNILSRFSYTLESIIQAGKKNLKIGYVSIQTNKEVLRPSRLFKNIPHYVRNSTASILRIYLMYEPLRTFLYIGAAILLLGLIPFVRFLYFWSIGQGSGHIQSLIFGAVLLNCAFLAFLFGMVGDLIASNRKLIEMILLKAKKLENDSGKNENDMHCFLDKAWRETEKQSLFHPEM